MTDPTMDDLVFAERLRNSTPMPHNAIFLRREGEMYVFDSGGIEITYTKDQAIS